MIDFRNKKVLITGATGGIGQALVKKLFMLAGGIVAFEVQRIDSLAS